MKIDQQMPVPIDSPPTLASNLSEPAEQITSHSELHRNQGWEAAGTLIKVAFFFLIPPIIVTRLGAVKFGEFALALSAMACVFAFDFGVRTQLRVLLSRHSKSKKDGLRARYFAQAILAWLVIYAGTLAACGVCSLLGGWSRFLSLRTNADALIFISVACSGLFLLSLILLEPIAAREQLSKIKAAAFFGNFLAIPVVLTLVWLKQPSWCLAAGYLLSQTLPNLWIAWAELRPNLQAMAKCLPTVTPHEIAEFLFAGRWLGFLNIQWLMKSYLLTFLVGGLMGLAEAGLFFVLLKFSELLSLFGTTSGETSVASLAGQQCAESRISSFRRMYLYSLAMSLPAFAALVCLAPWILQHYMKLSLPSQNIGIWAGLFGLAVGFKRLLTLVCMGTSLSHHAVFWGLVESALTVLGIVILYPHLKIGCVMLAGTLATFALFPPASRFALSLGVSSFVLWIRPALSFLILALLLSLSWSLGSWMACISILVLVAIVSWQNFKAAGHML